MDKKAVGLRLEQARILKGLRQKELAQRIGLGNSTISRYERGLEGMPPKMFNLIAVELDCDPSWLLTGKNAIENSLTTSVGMRLEQARILKGLRRTELAQRLNLSLNTISMYERDLRGIVPKIFNRIAAELNCSPTWLLTGTNNVVTSAVSSKDVCKHYTYQDLLNAPKWAQSYVNKYLLPIRASYKYKRNLKKFLKNWNRRHPQLLISYARFMSMRKKYQQNGVVGLYPHYGYMKESV